MLMIIILNRQTMPSFVRVVFPVGVVICETFSKLNIVLANMNSNFYHLEKCFLLF